MRYETGELLGQGGMGEVYRAFDPALQRPVALKFLRREEPRQIERLLREARAQAKVEHELVCKVYEVGEQDGRHYIAMQLIEGVPLDVAARSMTVEQRVIVVRDVAEAVHAAHRIGLVHRDLKPGNILVDSGGGAVRPYVTDFGLVRDDSAESLTRTGEAVGTPPYMAPEQARGELHRLDRRTDVYSLGAVLYELLAGRPPFVGKSAVEILFQVVHAEIPPLRKLVPSVPRDLEVIAARCLEKEPLRRYQSAKELADDLERWLDGDPIQARPTGFARKLWARARRHKLAAGAGAAGVLAAAALLAAVWQERAASVQKATLARAFGQAMERIEGGLRQAHLLPLHDTRPERARVRSRMREIEAEASRVGGWAAATASAALGRGHLALGELTRARLRLDEAWAAGERAPEVAYALGRSLGALYQRKLAEVEAIQDPARREEQRRVIEVDLRNPALAYLQKAEAAAGTRAFLDGLIALHEHRLDQALAHAARALAEEPALYEAHLLAGEAHLRRCTLAQGKGDFAAGAAANDAAGAAFARAAEIARSDPAVLDADCERWATRQRWEGFSNLKASSAEVHRSAGAACRKVLMADPDRADVLKRLGRVHQFRGDWQLRHGEDPTPVFLAGIDALEEAARRDPGDAEALGLQGPIHIMLAMWRRDHGGDWRISLEAGSQALTLAMQADPRSSRYPLNLGGLWFYRASFEVDDGRDPMPSYARALAAQEAAVAIEPRQAMNPYNLGVTHVRLSGLAVQRGLDPREHVAKAVEALERAVKIMPGFSWSHTMLGQAHVNLAQFEASSRRDPRPALAKARAALARSVALEPTSFNVHRVLGRLERLRAEGLLGDPGGPEAFAAARAELETALKANANDSSVRVEMARVEIATAADALRRGAPSVAPLQRASVLVDHVLRLNPGNIEGLVARGHLLLVSARAGVRPAARRERARKALAAFDAALARNPFLITAEVRPLRDEAARLAKR